MIYSFIIVNYNTKEITGNCIKSLIENEYLIKIEYEIIVIDNASIDNSESYIKSNFCKVKFINNVENLGFGRANNIGADIATGKYLVFINSDTIARDTDFDKLLEIMQKNNQVGFLSCKILNEDSSLQSVGYKFPSVLNEMKIRLLFWNFNFVKKIRLRNYKNKGLFMVDWLSGCFMICEKNLFISARGFDENIFMYSEDLDICYRMSLRGKTNFVYDETSIFHLHGKSGNKKYPSFRQLLKRKENYFYVIKKNKITKPILLIKLICYINVSFIFFAKKLISTKRLLSNKR